MHFRETDLGTTLIWGKSLVLPRVKCWKMLKIVEYWKISKIFEQCLKISEKCRKFSKKFKKSNVEKCRKMLKNVEKCGKMSKNVENYTKGPPCSALSPIQTNCSLRFSRTPPPRTNCHGYPGPTACPPPGGRVHVSLVNHYIYLFWYAFSVSLV